MRPSRTPMTWHDSWQIGDHGEFIAADAEKRRDIFNPSGTEIRKMLDENLLKTFLASTSFFNTCKRLDEEHGAQSVNVSLRSLLPYKIEGASCATVMRLSRLDE